MISCKSFLEPLGQNGRAAQLQSKATTSLFQRIWMAQKGSNTVMMLRSPTRQRSILQYWNFLLALEKPWQRLPRSKYALHIYLFDTSKELGVFNHQANFWVIFWFGSTKRSEYHLRYPLMGLISATHPKISAVSFGHWSINMTLKHLWIFQKMLWRTMKNSRLLLSYTDKLYVKSKTKLYAYKLQGRSTATQTTLHCSTANKNT